jgi:hypothetical protein
MEMEGRKCALQIWCKDDYMLDCSVHFAICCKGRDKPWHLDVQSNS